MPTFYCSFTYKVISISAGENPTLGVIYFRRSNIRICHSHIRHVRRIDSCTSICESSLLLTLLRGITLTDYHCRTDSEVDEGNMCKIWHSRANSQRQWTSIHQRGLARILQAVWHTAHHTQPHNPQGNGQTFLTHACNLPSILLLLLLCSTTVRLCYALHE